MHAEARELGGQIVCEFTDEETGRRDDRADWSRLVKEAKEPDACRFDSVIVYATSRLSRDLFHALAYERELAKAGVEVFYVLTAGDQTSPEGRLIRHLFQALDQFEVEKLGREVRRGQTENTRQGYRNGGRAPTATASNTSPTPTPPVHEAGDTKSRLVPDAEQAPVIAEMFERYLPGWGYKEIANHLNRPGGPPPPRHVDSKRNTAGKWSKTTIRSMLENPVYIERPLLEPTRLPPSKAGRGPTHPPLRRGVDRRRRAPRGARLSGGLRAGPGGDGPPQDSRAEAPQPPAALLPAARHRPLRHRRLLRHPDLRQQPSRPLPIPAPRPC